MANVTSFQKLRDSNKEAIIKITNRLDGTTTESGRVVVDASNLAFALNSTGGIKSTGGVGVNPMTRYKIDVVKILASLGPGVQVMLQYDNSIAANQQNSIIAVLGPGFSKVDEEGLFINNPHFTTNSNGNILISTTGLTANSGYDITMWLRKDPTTYSAGQHADPGAFGRFTS
jgi:hypothetical protein